jgi:hypothetical protein
VDIRLDRPTSKNGMGTDPRPHLFLESRLIHVEGANGFHGSTHDSFHTHLPPHGGLYDVHTCPQAMRVDSPLTGMALRPYMPEHFPVLVAAAAVVVVVVHENEDDLYTLALLERVEVMVGTAGETQVR